MHLDHINDLSNFFSELQRETDRGLPLVGAALIDEILIRTLKAFFIDSKSSDKLLTEINAPLGTFSSRIEICFALGLIDDFEYREISLIRKVRNEFAHVKHGLSFKDAKIRGFCSSLKSDLPKDSDYPTKDSRFRFINAVVCTVLRLYYRPEWVGKERRISKVWVTSDQTRWRSVEEELPPEGVPVIAMAKRLNANKKKP